MADSGEGAELEELEALYRDDLPSFRRVAAAIVGNREVARDVVQEAFARAVRRRSSYRGDGPLAAWVWRIVVNEALENHRRPDATSDHPDLSRNGHAEPSAESHVRVALSMLPERQRLIVFLRYYADLDYKTIAEALDIETGTVGVTLHAARARLQRLLEEAPR